MKDVRTSEADAFPRAILHFDGDSFFASVEQAMNHRLRGKPVVTGGERGAATSLSIEAKQAGLRRSMSMQEIRAVCPSAIVVKSDYTSYSIFARRMYAIARRFTPRVQEYSIDECFADITDVREHFRASYPEIATMIKRELEKSLGITFGVGLSTSKVLAKAASKKNKPAGLTVVPLAGVREFLSGVPIGKVWGIGGSMSVYLGNKGIRTALDFAQKPAAWLFDNGISKPYRDMWHELNGTLINEIRTIAPETHDRGRGFDYADEEDIGSIMKTRTFTPPSRNAAYIFAQLSRNIEGACAKARLRGVRAREVTFTLKTQEFTYQRLEHAFVVPTSNPNEIIAAIARQFLRVYVPGIEYRATGVSLRSLVPERSRADDLFGESLRIDAADKLFGSIDSVNKRYGRETLYLASSMKAVNQPARKDGRLTVRPHRLTLPIHQRKKVVDLPFLGVAA